MKDVYKRIVVLGTSGSGKSVLAQQISDKLNIKRVELDNMAWGPNWEIRTAEDIVERIQAEIDGLDHWVMDGNYSKVRDFVWKDATVLIWLDYPFYKVFWRIWWRTWGRWWNQTEMWDSKNTETMWKHFLPNENSIFYWVITSYKRRKRQYNAVKHDPRYIDKLFIHFRTQAEVDAWLEKL